MKIIQATDVRNNFQEFINKVHYTNEPFIISKHGKPWVMVKPLDENDEKLQKIIARWQKEQKG